MKNDTKTAEGFTPLPAGLELEITLYATNGEVNITLSVVSQFEPNLADGIGAAMHVDDMLATLPKFGESDQPWRAMTRGEIANYKAEEAAVEHVATLDDGEL